MGEVSELHSQRLKNKNTRGTELPWRRSLQSPHRLLQLLVSWAASLGCYCCCCCYRAILRRHLLPSASQVTQTRVLGPQLVSCPKPAVSSWWWRGSYDSSSRSCSPSYPLAPAGTVRLQSGCPEEGDPTGAQAEPSTERRNPSPPKAGRPRPASTPEPGQKGGGGPDSRCSGWKSKSSYPSTPTLTPSPHQVLFIKTTGQPSLKGITWPRQKGGASGPRTRQPMGRGRRAADFLSPTSPPARAPPPPREQRGARGGASELWACRSRSGAVSWRLRGWRAWRAGTR